MKNVISLILIGLFGTFNSIPAHAEAALKLEAYFEQKVSQVQKALLSLDQAEPATHGSFIYQDMNVDLTPEFSIGLGTVLNLTVSPEVDFVLTPVAP